MSAIGDLSKGKRHASCAMAHAVVASLVHHDPSADLPVRLSQSWRIEKTLESEGRRR